MKEYALITTVIIGIFAAFGIFYALFAGIWGFNPTFILWFNTKLGISCIIIVIIVSAILREN